MLVEAQDLVFAEGWFFLGLLSTTRERVEPGEPEHRRLSVLHLADVRVPLPQPLGLEWDKHQPLLDQAPEVACLALREQLPLLLVARYVVFDGVVLVLLLWLVVQGHLYLEQQEWYRL